MVCIMKQKVEFRDGYHYKCDDIQIRIIIHMDEPVIFSLCSQKRQGRLGGFKRLSRGVVMVGIIKKAPGFYCPKLHGDLNNLCFNFS